MKDLGWRVGIFTRGTHAHLATKVIENGENGVGEDVHFHRGPKIIWELTWWVKKWSSPVPLVT
jgi:hypothetical protein